MDGAESWVKLDRVRDWFLKKEYPRKFRIALGFGARHDKLRHFLSVLVGSVWL
jgi:hypothetical protein